MAPLEVFRQEADAIHFQTSLGNSRLRGVGSLRCLMLGGKSLTMGTAAEAFVRENSDQGRLLFFFCLSTAAEEAVRKAVRSDRCVIYGAEQVVESWSSDQFSVSCEKQVRGNVPLRMLTPYDITVSATGPMFYGREAELGRLSQEDGQSFAVTGAGRIGKTSLVKKYKAELLRKGDPAHDAVFYLDFFECDDKSPDSLARRIAMTMDSSRRADRTRADDLASFIEYQAHRLHRKPTC